MKDKKVQGALDALQEALMPHFKGREICFIFSQTGYKIFITPGAASSVPANTSDINRSTCGSNIASDAQIAYLQRLEEDPKLSKQLRKMVTAALCNDELSKIEAGKLIQNCVKYLSSPQRNHTKNPNIKPLQ